MDTLLTIAKCAALEAGDAIMRLYATTDFETKTDGSPLTIADTQSNEIILRHLKTTGVQILSEETLNIETPYPDRLWIIDPLDGTKDFLKKNGDFAVMIGLIEHGRPILGVVYAPAYATLYFATKGSGTFMTTNGVTTQLKVSKQTTDLRFVRSINHFSPQMELLSKKLNASLHPRGSIGIKAGMLIEARAEFFASWGNFGEWDTCAAEILVSEAGGKVTDCNGEPIFYGTTNHLVQHGIVYTNGECHDQVLDAVRSISTQDVID